MSFGNRGTVTRGCVGATAAFASHCHGRLLAQRTESLIVLLFKSKEVRPKDQNDFDAVLPLLDARRRQWLADAIRHVDPTHRWLPALRM